MYTWLSQMENVDYISDQTGGHLIYYVDHFTNYSCDLIYFVLRIPNSNSNLSGVIDIIFVWNSLSNNLQSLASILYGRLFVYTAIT